MKRHKGKIIFFGLLGVIFIGYIVYSIYYFNIASKYTISNNTKAIQKHIMTWENRSDEKLIPTLLQVVHLEDSDTYVALFKHQDGNVGMAVMKEGTNKKLQIISSRYGTNITNYDYVTTNKGKYGVVSGKNPNNKISSIRVELLADQFNFEVNVPQKPYYIVVKKLPKGISSNIASNTYFYDENRVEIDPRQIF